MFDRKCKDCIVLKRIKNAFVREEHKNSELIIQMVKHTMMLLLLMSKERKS